MPHSDDFGLDDDGTEFLVAATQVGATQQAGFEASPRPTKRRKVRQQGLGELYGADDEESECFEHDGTDCRPPRVSGYFRSTALQTQATTTITQNGGDSAESNEYHYFPGELSELGAEEIAKQSKYRIHVPQNGERFPDMIFSQTQHGLDDNMAKFRGAVWKRPPAQPPPKVGGIANQNGFGNGLVRAGSNSIASYFHAAGRTNPPEDDAALAARLQAEEVALGKQSKTNPMPQMTDKTLNLDISQQELATQLADLPEDAFSSSSPEKSPNQNVVELSSQLDGSQPARPRAQALRAPQTSLRQLDLFGQATQELTASQAANKRHAWPLTSKEEPPTHHKLDQEAMRTWIYPTNLGTVRAYQYSIVSSSLFNNTLVALPTGLGKTFIAATIMLNYYRWTTDAKLIFMAPTKPLIAQQMEACYGVVGISRKDTVLMTGETTPALRADEWQEKRVFFMTPQTVINDLKTGIADPKKIVLLIVDEAHKATGGYAYCEVVSFMRRFNPSFRVLALTATPGSTTEAVQAVIDNLGIARVELRTEISIDIRQYTHEKQTETEVFDTSPEQEHIMELMSKALKPSLDKLNSQNGYWSKDPMQLTAYGLTTSRQKWMQSETGRKAPQPVKAMVNSIFTVLAGLAHSINLLKHHGIGPFYQGVLAFQKGVDSGEHKGKTASAIAQSEHFTKMLSMIRTWTNNPEFIGHPKLEYLREVVLNHFLDAGEGRQGSEVPPSATRVMIFASYRDSTEEISRVLKRSEPMIRPHVFVGQAASKGQQGMDQKRQNSVIQDFKSGKFNTLIATSIGEEGLDIGTVDLIVNYDASASPIRMLQRIGRTGRKRLGRVVLLLMRGKEERDYEKAQDNYIYIQKTIADPDKYSYRHDQSPRILPREVRPVPDKRPVDIPVENSQPVDLNEKGRKSRGKGKTKAPPKKFHMPDGVRTTFTKASTLGAESDTARDEDKLARKNIATTIAKKKATFVKPRELSLLDSHPDLEPEPAPLPYLVDVFLKDTELEELQSKYAQAASGSEDLIISPPDHERFPDKLRELGSTKHIRHGEAALLVEKTMKAVREIDTAQCHALDEALHMSDLEDAGPIQVCLVSPEIETGHDPSLLWNKPQHVSSSITQPQSLCKKAPSPQHMVSDPDSEDELPAQRALPATAKRPRGRPRKKKRPLQRAISYESAAGEGDESSPEATPADMRLATQGEDLGSEDTSGEDEEEIPNSDDRAFIAGTSDPLELVSSSQLRTPAETRPRRLKKRPMRRASLESVPEMGNDDDGSHSDLDNESEDGSELVAKSRRRRVVDESDDD